MSNNENQILLESLMEKMNNDDKAEVQLKFKAGMVFSGVNEEKELEWIATNKEWSEFEQLYNEWLNNPDMLKDLSF